ERGLEVPRATGLASRHRAAAAQLRVGEAIEEVGVTPRRQVERRGPELTELEADEAIERQRLVNRSARPQALVEEQAVAAEARGLEQGGGGGGAEIAGGPGGAGGADPAMGQGGGGRGAL